MSRAEQLRLDGFTPEVGSGALAHALGSRFRLPGEAFGRLDRRAGHTWVTVDAAWASRIPTPCPVLVAGTTVTLRRESDLDVPASWLDVTLTGLSSAPTPGALAQALSVAGEDLGAIGLAGEQLTLRLPAWRTRLESIPETLELAGVAYPTRVEKKNSDDALAAEPVVAAALRRAVGLGASGAQLATAIRGALELAGVEAPALVETVRRMALAEHRPQPDPQLADPFLPVLQLALSPHRTWTEWLDRLSRVAYPSDATRSLVVSLGRLLDEHAGRLTPEPESLEHWLCTHAQAESLETRLGGLFVPGLAARVASRPCPPDTQPRSPLARQFVDVVMGTISGQDRTVAIAELDAAVRSRTPSDAELGTWPELHQRLLRETQRVGEPIETPLDEAIPGTPRFEAVAARVADRHLLAGHRNDARVTLQRALRTRPAAVELQRRLARLDQRYPSGSIDAVLEAGALLHASRARLEAWQLLAARAPVDAPVAWLVAEKLLDAGAPAEAARLLGPHAPPELRLAAARATHDLTMATSAFVALHRAELGRTPPPAWLDVTQTDAAPLLGLAPPPPAAPRRSLDAVAQLIAATPDPRPPLRALALHPWEAASALTLHLFRELIALGRLDAMALLALAELGPSAAEALASALPTDTVSSALKGADPELRAAMVALLSQVPEDRLPVPLHELLHHAPEVRLAAAELALADGRVDESASIASALLRRLARATHLRRVLTVLDHATAGKGLVPVLQAPNDRVHWCAAVLVARDELVEVARSAVNGAPPLWVPVQVRERLLGGEHVER